MLAEAERTVADRATRRRFSAVSARVCVWEARECGGALTDAVPQARTRRLRNLCAFPEIAVEVLYY